MLTLLFLYACTTEDSGKDSAGGDDGPDLDADGYVDATAGGDDCDDGDDAVHPGATEVCNEVDDDCDGTIDVGATDATTWCEDNDGDGFGDLGTAVAACAASGTLTADCGDCDDGDADVRPSASEVCDGIDNDCNQMIDLDDPAVVDKVSGYVDGDGDGYGVGEVVESCDASGLASEAGDCDDGDGTVHPDAEERCDGLDGDCDGDATDAGLVTRASNNYTSITLALSAASDGDTIEVCAGTYTENLKPTVSVTLHAFAGPEATILDGGGTSSVIVAGTDTDLVVDGFTVQNGKGHKSSKYSNYSLGGGIAAEDALSLVVRDCVFTSNTAQFGGAVLGPLYGTATIEDSTFSGNTSSISGGALYVANATFTNSPITGNTGLYAGGVMCDGSLGDAVCSFDEGSVIEENTATSFAGGLIALGYVDTTTVEIVGARVLGNAAPDGGGAEIEGDVLFTDVVFDGNTATGSAGAVLGQNGSLAWTSGEVTYNTAAGTAGGVYLYGMGADITDVSFSSNAAETGGALQVDTVGDDVTVTLTGGAVLANEALADPGEGGGAGLSGSTLVSVGVDWGTDDTDNAPDDLWLSATSTSYAGFGAAASFTCVDDGSTGCN